MVEAILYIFICVLTGVCGWNTRIGLLGTFIIALVVTPLPVLSALMLTSSSRPVERNRRRVPRV